MRANNRPTPVMVRVVRVSYGYARRSSSSFRTFPRLRALCPSVATSTLVISIENTTPQLKSLNRLVKTGSSELIEAYLHRGYLAP